MAPRKEFSAIGFINEKPFWRSTDNTLQLQRECHFSTRRNHRESIYRGCRWVVISLPDQTIGYQSKDDAKNPARLRHWISKRGHVRRFLFQGVEQNFFSQSIPARIPVRKVETAVNAQSRCEDHVTVAHSEHYHFNALYSGSYTFYAFSNGRRTWTKENRLFIRWMENIFPGRGRLAAKNGWVVMAKDGTVRFYSDHESNCPYEGTFAFFEL